jgi:hypothetical protein
LLAAVETENLIELEAPVADLHRDAPLHPLRQLFDCEPNDVASKAPIGHRTLFRAQPTVM